MFNCLKILVERRAKTPSRSLQKIKQNTPEALIKSLHCQVASFFNEDLHLDHTVVKVSSMIRNSFKMALRGHWFALIYIMVMHHQIFLRSFSDMMLKKGV